MQFRYTTELRRNVCRIRDGRPRFSSRFWYGTTAHFLSVRSNCEESVVNVSPSERSQADFSIALPAFALVDQDRYAIFVLSSIPGGGLRSRLFRELRERSGLLEGFTKLRSTHA